MMTPKESRRSDDYTRKQNSLDALRFKLLYYQEKQHRRLREH